MDCSWGFGFLAGTSLQVLLRNGTAILGYKTWPDAALCRKLIGAPTCKAIGIASTHNSTNNNAAGTGVGGWNGSFAHLPMGDRFVAVGSDIEDPSLYQDPASGALHMLMHTDVAGGAGGSAHSTDLGKTWSFDVTKQAYDYTVTIVRLSVARSLFNGVRYRAEGVGWVGI